MNTTRKWSRAELVRLVVLCFVVSFIVSFLIYIVVPYSQQEITKGHGFGDKSISKMKGYPDGR